MTFDLSHDEAGEKRSVTIDESGVLIIDLPDEMYEFSTEDDDAFEQVGTPNFLLYTVASNTL